MSSFVVYVPHPFRQLLPDLSAKRKQTGADLGFADPLIQSKVKTLFPVLAAIVLALLAAVPKRGVNVRIALVNVPDTGVDVRIHLVNVPDSGVDVRIPLADVPARGVNVRRIAVIVPVSRAQPFDPACSGSELRPMGPGFYLLAVLLKMIEYRNFNA